MATTDSGLRGLPSGTVTLLLGDVEGSVKAWEADAESASLARIRFEEIAGHAVARHRGARPAEQGEGDNLVIAFSRASDAVACALDLQLAYNKEPWPGSIDLRVRIALHTGEVEIGSDGKYAGSAINRCARLRGLAHGGQTLLSQAAYEVAADALPPEVTIRDLGRHRLRDLTRPERVYQLTHPDLPHLFPPLRSLDAVPNNLPLQLTSFIGRETEMDNLKSLIAGKRFVTLTGSGGCGKTRLALQFLADSLDGYPDGVWWVDLAPLSDPDVVTAKVASILSVRESESESTLETLIRQLRDRHIMILLDNCEHLLDSSAHLASALLKECPSVWLVATSREAVGVEGEVSYRVPSLSFPSADLNLNLPEDPAAFESVKLFIDRAKQVRPHFGATAENAAAIATICRRLDGIPLAIEWAAARIRMLSPAQIADALSERFDLLIGGARTALPRQRTLEASLDWSFNLLSVEERTVLARLSVFSGTFDLNAAEEITQGGGIDRYRILDLLSGLVDKSLLQVEESGSDARYRLLETVRAYARQRLVDSGELSDVRNGHLDYYVTLAEGAEPELRGPWFSEWSRRLTEEIDNLRTALEWAISSHQEEKHLRLTGALLVFWVNRSMYAEIQQSMEVALSGATDRAVRAKALSSAALMSVMAARYRSAVELARECVELAREINDERSLGWALLSLGWAEFWMGERGLDHMEEAVRLGKELADSHLEISASIYRGVLEGAMNSLAAAIPLLDDAIVSARALGDEYLLSTALFFRGLSSEGRPVEAKAFFEECMEVSRSVDDRTLLSYAKSELSEMAVIEGDYAGARALVLEAFEIARELGGITAAFARHNLASLEFVEGNLDAAETHATQLLEEWRGSELVWFVASLTSLLGEVSLARGDLQSSRMRLEEALEWSRKSQWPRLVAEALYYLGRLARSEGDVTRAESLVHEALDVTSKYGYLPGICDALEYLAGIAAQLESYEEAVRLFGGAARLRELIGYVRFPAMREGYEVDIAGVRETLAEEVFDRAWTEGLALTMGEAIDYARRGRGERKRPTVGWGSLTPTELEVVRLVSQGLSNPQIAERLFIARNTVKAHMSHIFSKLGTASRAELAAEATRRGL